MVFLFYATLNLQMKVTLPHTIELSFDSNWSFGWAFVSLVSFDACLMLVWRLEQGAFYWFIEDQTHFGMPQGAKLSLVPNGLI